MAEFLTSEGFEKLKKELFYLENIKRKEVSEKLRHTASFGDLSENAAYDEAKEAQAFLERRILELKKIIAGAKIIKKRDIGEVQIGSTVSLASDGEKEEFQIVGPEEADVFSGKISYLSPLGKLLLGKAKGSKVIMKTPESKIEYQILEIK